MDKNASSSKPGAKKPADARNALVHFFFLSTERIKVTTFISLTWAAERVLLQTFL